uniref:Uncharacterized protein n=2 Tax=Anthurium amnicola TaxID=1678845 RepID=A0A1D1XJY6_9ARAE
MALKEHGCHVATFERDLDMELVLDDGRRALSGILHEEKILKKKRRWLMASLVNSQSANKRLGTSRFFRNAYLPESFVRSDDVSLQDIRMLVQRGFRSSIKNKGFKRMHREMREIIEERPPELLAQSSSDHHFEKVNISLQILSDITSLASISSSLVSSISRILEVLEDLPSQALIAMNRKLKDVTVAPQFPVAFSCKRNILIERLRKKCHKILSTLTDGCKLPRSLAKALSVICLSLKQMTRQVDISTTKFFPFTPEIEDLHNEILKAIWSLPNVNRGELRHLQYLVAPNVNLPMKSLRKALHNYLLEYLFQCDEVPVPKPFFMALKLINKRYQHQIPGAEETAEEVESILNVSSHLRQMVLDSFPDENMDQEFASACAEGVSTNEDDCDIMIDENEDCSTFGYSDYLQICESYSDEEVEGTGESMPVDSCLTFNLEGRSSAQLMEGKGGVGCRLKEEPQLDQNGSSAESCHQLSPTKPNMTDRYLTLKSICDDTSLVAHKLIVQLIEEFVQKSNKKVHEATEFYLRDGASSTSNSQDTEKARSLPEELKAALLQVTGQRMPSFPNGGIERVKELMKWL